MPEKPEEMKQFMERLERSNAGQEKYAKLQYRMSQITAAASILILCIVLYTAAEHADYHYSVLCPGFFSRSSENTSVLTG